MTNLTVVVTLTVKESTFFCSLYIQIVDNINVDNTKRKLVSVFLLLCSSKHSSSFYYKSFNT